MTTLELIAVTIFAGSIIFAGSTFIAVPLWRIANAIERIDQRHPDRQTQQASEAQTSAESGESGLAMTGNERPAGRKP